MLLILLLHLVCILGPLRKCLLTLITHSDGVQGDVGVVILGGGQSRLLPQPSLLFFGIHVSRLICLVLSLNIVHCLLLILIHHILGDYLWLLILMLVLWVESVVLIKAKIVLLGYNLPLVQNWHLVIHLIDHLIWLLHHHLLLLLLLHGPVSRIC